MNTRLVVTVLFVVAVAVNTATAQDTTTAAPTTTINATEAPPLTPNTTVEFLNTTISRNGCGTEQLCVSQSVCDPSADGSCFFLSAKLLSGLNYQLGLSGNSSGYIAVTLSPDGTVGNNDTTYVCANNNNTVLFFSTVLNNNKLEERNLSVNSVKGRVNGTKIQCTFSATVPTLTTRGLNMMITIFNGTYNISSRELGTPIRQLQGNVTDLSNPNTTVVFPTSPGPANYGITFQQSLTQALLITAGVLGLAIV